MKNKENMKASSRILEAAKLKKDQLFKEYDLRDSGLSTEEVEESREKYGSNAIAKKKKDNVIKKLFLSFVTPFTIVLFVLAGISLFTDIIMPPEGEKNYITVIMVVSMVLISGIMTFIQEFKSEKAA